MFLPMVCTSLSTRSIFLAPAANARAADDEHLKILTANKDKNPAEAEQLLITHLKHIWQGLNVTGYASSQNDLADILGGSL